MKILATFFIHFVWSSAVILWVLVAVALAAPSHAVHFHLSTCAP